MEGFLAHEIAHQWWGRASGHYRDQWLSEGFPSISVLYLQSKYGEDARTDILKKFSRWTVKKSVWGPITMGSRLSFTNFDAYQAIIYDKTALVLNMLRDLLGDEVFFSGLKAFFEEHKHAAASTGQFRRTFEAASGQDLDAFFGLWFDSHLLPDVQVRAQVDKRETGVIKITVNQLNADFVFPLWVAWEDGLGAPHREMLIVDRKNKAFEFPLPGPLRKLEVNPDRAVPGEFQVSKD
jgi:aminopeptidase N